MYHIISVGCEQFEYGRLDTGLLYNYRYFYTCNISLKKSMLLKEEVLFDSSFNLYGFEDVELSYRLRTHGLSIFYHEKAIGYHNHPYTFTDFCLRQEKAGKMAVVFSQLHGDGVESITSVKRLTHHYHKIYGSSDPNSKYQTLVDSIFCFLNVFDVVESNKLPFEIASSLSYVYTACFSCFYNTGLIQGYFSFNNEYLLSEYFVKEYCTRVFVRHLENLANYSVNVMGSVSHIDYKWLADLKLIINKSPKLYIHVNQEELVLFEEKYKKIEQAEVVSSLDKIIESPDIWVYSPSSINGSISSNQLNQVIIAASLYSQTCNLFVVSHSLSKENEIQTCDRDGCVIKRLTLVHGNMADDNLTGKVLRLLPTLFGEQSCKMELSELLGREVYLNEDGFFRTFETYFSPYRIEVMVYDKLIKLFKADLPIIFVFPSFLANGGVERNLYSVVEKLQERYHFVIINTEKLESEYGNLYSAFSELSSTIIDLAELTLPNIYLDVLKELKRVYSPEVIWICNGSSWLQDNAIVLRGFLEMLQS